MANQCFFVKCRNYFGDLPRIPLVYDGPKDELFDWIVENVPERETAGEPMWIHLASCWDEKYLEDEEYDDRYDHWDLAVESVDTPDGFELGGPITEKTVISITGQKSNGKDVDPLEIVYPGPIRGFLQWVIEAFPDRDVSDFPDLTIRLGHGWDLNLHLEETEIEE